MLELLGRPDICTGVVGGGGVGGVTPTGVGTGGARPPKFCQVPFFREQSGLFLREKCH
jgi:hypothetical protein